MTIRLAHTAYDGTLTFRDARQRSVAHAGSPQAIGNLLSDRWYRDWRGYGSPDQMDGLFLMVAPGHSVEDIPLDPGATGWLGMSAAEIQEFITD